MHCNFRQQNVVFLLYRVNESVAAADRNECQIPCQSEVLQCSGNKY